jgi:eukaryotic-like serine/threonine-protein kinase
MPDGCPFREGGGVRIVGKLLAVVFGLVLLALGGYGLLAAYAPDGGLTGAVRGALAGVSGLPVPAAQLEGVLASPLLRFVLAPLGLVLLLWAMRGGSGAGAAEGIPAASGVEGDAAALDRRLVKKTEKQAAALRKKGMVIDAAEMLFSAGVMDRAAEYFIEGEEFVRAAEIRHDQNRFLESAALYERAGKYESAGAIYGQQEEFGKAAECYLKAEGKSVAAEMFEKAGDHRRAGDCYREVGFLRHAAQAYVGCKAWLKAAECLQEVFRDENTKVAQNDPRKQAELGKLVRQGGKLFERAGEPERALAFLELGGCAPEAAELALRLGQHAKAAELFQRSGDPRRAAEALEQLGEHEAASRILGEYHRDQGDLKRSAESFEAAGEWLAAGDLYRQIEEHAKAGECYAKQGEHAQAAEMFRLAGDRARAGEHYEHAGAWGEAAECFALAGDPQREARLLERGGFFLRAGQSYHQHGLDDEAIRVLQQVEAGSEHFSEASALLGDLFRARGQVSLAIKKLEQAIGGAELGRDNLAMFYMLATLHEADGQTRQAVEVYEKILALDYHYKDVEARLARSRDAAVSMSPTVASTAGESGSHGFTPSGQPGRYQIVGELGRGGMGIVFKAKDTTLDRIVAYKVLPDSLKENPQALKNFLREAKSAAQLNHPNIVTVYDAGEQDGRYYIAMEYVDGTTLKEILRRRGLIAPAGILHVAVQMSEALAYAHDKKIVHRDIKTANTMWTRDKKAKIMDFGLARVVEEVRNHTTVVSGTPYYMSPEQTLGRNIDHRTDIYSLGVTLFELASGTVPFKEGNIPYHHVHTPAPDVRQLNPKLPEPLADIIARCLRKSPDERYQSAREILAEVKASLSQGSVKGEG